MKTLLENLPASLVVLNLAATLYMVGLSWFVQRVRCPLFARVGRAEFPIDERDHVARTGPVVGPAMLVEAGVRRRLSGRFEAGVRRRLSGRFEAGVHRRLSGRFEAGVRRRLVAGNWIRTAAWCLRGLLVSGLALRLLRGGPGLDG